MTGGDGRDKKAPAKGGGAALLVGVVAVFVNTTALAFQGSEVTVKEWTAVLG